MNSEKHIVRDARRLLSQLDLYASFRLIHLDGGKNNRVYLLKTGHQKYLLKKYFSHPRDPRDRLNTEFAFSSFAWNSGIRQIPKPLAIDTSCRCALYEFIEGRAFQKGEVQEEHVNTAMDFLRDLNRSKDSFEANRIMRASEACFTIEDHIKCVEKRIKKLKTIPLLSDISKRTHKFIEKKLAVFWNETRASILLKADSTGLPIDQIIDRDEQCLSPSDFGFHNAILDNNGGVRFVDFEYAGWDDLAKTICDFFCQVQVPVPLQYLTLVESEIDRICHCADEVLHRARLLFPVHRIKWCCIMLNEFLSVDAERRVFSSDDRYHLDLGERLKQASDYFENLCIRPAF